jgi:hypothetical protein
MLIRYELEEMIQICIILFTTSLAVSFCTSNIFTLVDNEILKIEDIYLQRFSMVMILFCQLLLTAIIYLFIDTFLFKIKSLRSLLTHKDGTLGQLHAAEYCIHIVLILVLIEMNASLMFEIEYVRDFMVLVPVLQKKLNPSEHGA